MESSRPSSPCRFWRGGLCAIFDRATYCPRARAENARTGECISDPLHELWLGLRELRRAGVDVSSLRGLASASALAQLPQLLAGL